LSEIKEQTKIRSENEFPLILPMYKASFILTFSQLVDERLSPTILNNNSNQQQQEEKAPLLKM
jgi:hypothetical protein